MGEARWQDHLPAKLQSPGLCIYVDIHVETVPIAMLVDTGASASCITKRSYLDHCQEFGQLEAVNMIVAGANGSALPGYLSCSLRIGRNKRNPGKGRLACVSNIDRHGQMHYLS